MKSETHRISDTNPFGLRMNPEVRRQVEERAAQMDRSLNWTINDLLKKALGLEEPTL